jgi:hypothetical protein
MSTLTPATAGDIEPHGRDVASVASRLDVDVEQGLSTAEAQSRLE